MIQAAHLRVTGIVQGVGFRPFIYSLAQRFHLLGWVRNTTAGVEIEVDGPREILEQFAAAIRADAPPLARIDEIAFTLWPPAGHSGFQILESEEVAEAFQPITADVAICGDCLRELFDPNDRRYRYPFINCTNCGPRFTIIKDIPYDRPFTTMAPFNMCPDCSREYHDPRDRRFHAQPVACPVCGPHVWLATGAAQKPAASGDEALERARKLLADGRILAVKGLGGFHLACDATNRMAVQELRRRKLRVDKPFAVMLSNVGETQRQCLISDEERHLLMTAAAPIVLLQRAAACSIVEEVAPGQSWLGVMLPYTPLHHLLIRQSAGFPAGLVMTSGNVSEEPIAIGNEEAAVRLSSLADAFLFHDREIHMRCDDSVVRWVPVDRAGFAKTFGSGRATGIYPLRRSRGYAPYPVRLPWSVDPLLAVGGELKNTFCVAARSHAFMSHHIGDLENYETLRSLEQGVRHFEHLFHIRPRLIARDMHPDYLSTRYADARGAEEDIQVQTVQHHHAHVASCMAEHNLDGVSKVIGVAFDGTGYGIDGAIWGGEFLLADYLDFDRRLHVPYFPLPGGDTAIERPARVALAMLWGLGLPWDSDLAPVGQFTDSELDNLQVQLERNVNCLQTSSMGRVFDAAASLLGVMHRVNYEAQAAIELEGLVDESETGAYGFMTSGAIDLAKGFGALLEDYRTKVPVPRIAGRFHNGIAAMVAATSAGLRESTGCNQIVLSGGVWQNITLLRRTLSLLHEREFQVYIHREVPPNDGGLALGQAAIAAARMRAGNVPWSAGTNNQPS